MRNVSRHSLVLGIFPNTRGFAFALFEGPLAPVDWGVVRIRGSDKNRKCIARIAKLFGQYQPDILVLQDISATGTWRSARIRELNEAIETLAETQDIGVVKFTRTDVRNNFVNQGFQSRYAMAEAIANNIPMLRRFVPPVRKLWMTEDPKVALFESIGLILTWYNERRPTSS
jgi:hypothetical protein